MSVPRNSWCVKIVTSGILLTVFFAFQAHADSEGDTSSQKVVSFFGKLLGSDAVTGDAREVAEKLAEKIKENFPDPERQYQIALIAWALNQRADDEPTEETVYNKRVFLAAMSALSAKSNPNAAAMIMKIADTCKLEGGDLVMALEWAYPDPDKFREEALRRGITVMDSNPGH